MRQTSDMPHRMLLALKASPGWRPNSLSGSAEHGAVGLRGRDDRLPARDRGAGDGGAAVAAEGDATGTHWLGRHGGG